MEDSPPPQPARNTTRDRIVWVVIVLAVAAFVISSLPTTSDSAEIPFGQVIDDARAGRIDTLDLSGEKVTATYIAEGTADPVVRTSKIAENVDLAALLRAEGIAITRAGSQPGDPVVELSFNQHDSGGMAMFVSLLLSVLPFALVGLFMWWMFRQSRSATIGASGFGKSHARLFTAKAVTVTFADVAGADEAKEELAEIVEFLRTPAKFAALGAHIPKGILLLGPPGTGKTLLARAVAGEAGVPFFSISGSEFVELYVGVGASRARDLFAQAKLNAPCIIFLDEIDAVGRQRGAGVGGSHDEREQTLNQILVEMDGFEADTSVIVIAATNRPDILDPALIRPGRFDRKVVLDAPDVKGREDILRIHTRGKPIDESVSVKDLAKMTPGFTGADLANLVNEAAILAARREMRTVGPKEFEEAVDRVLAGPARKSRILSLQERRLTAYHEGGHVVLGHFLEHHDRPQKVTIISRGLMGGYTRFLPEEETHFRTPEMLQDQICAALGGHCAETLVFGAASTGPSNDLEQVSKLARAMVTRWGMSERLGPITFGSAEEMAFLGREGLETRNYSESTAEEIDAEVRRIVDAQRQRAIGLLSDHRSMLDRLASKLLEVETLQGEQLDQLLDDTATPEDLRAVDPAPASPGEEAVAAFATGPGTAR